MEYILLVNETDYLMLFCIIGILSLLSLIAVAVWIFWDIRKGYHEFPMLATSVVPVCLFIFTCFTGCIIIKNGTVSYTYKVGIKESLQHYEDYDYTLVRDITPDSITYYLIKYGFFEE